MYRRQDECTRVAAVCIKLSCSTAQRPPLLTSLRFGRIRDAVYACSSPSRDALFLHISILSLSLSSSNTLGLYYAAPRSHISDGVLDKRVLTRNFGRWSIVEDVYDATLCSQFGASARS